MLKFIAKLLVFVSLLSAASLMMEPALASKVSGLYDVEILVADESTATREQAFIKGLDEVFVRIAGDSIVMDKLERPPASRYVRQFSYVPVEEPVVNDNDELLTHRLKIRYNGHAMEKYLLNYGFPVWGDHRPDVVVWLVVRDGRNEYVLKQKDNSQIKAAAIEALSRRGVPVKWPAYDSKDKKILSVSDIRGGFKEPVIEASQRYSRGPALTGSMIWNGRKWQSSWSLLMEDEDRHWNIDETDHKRLLDRSINQAADALGVVFALRSNGDKQQLKSVLLDVQAVRSIESYSYVENYLAGLSAVTRVKPFRVDGQNAVYEVMLRSDERDFINLINNDAELTEVKEKQTTQGSAQESVQADRQKPVVVANEADKQQTTPQPDPAAVTKTLPLSTLDKTKSATVSGSAATDKQPAAVDAVAVDSVVASEPVEAAEQRTTYFYRLKRPR